MTFQGGGDDNPVGWVGVEALQAIGADSDESVNGNFDYALLQLLRRHR